MRRLSTFGNEACERDDMSGNGMVRIMVQHHMEAMTFRSDFERIPISENETRRFPPLVLIGKKAHRAYKTWHVLLGPRPKRPRIFKS